MSEKRIGLLGATSLVGECLIPLLVQDGWSIKAFSRRSVKGTQANVKWLQLGEPSDPHYTAVESGGTIDYWICVAPIWVLPDCFCLLESQGVRRVVVLSSTSRFTKDNSSDPEEQLTARRLAEGEACVQAWASDHGVEWVILRPTLIYGRGRDKNVSEIVRFIRRFGFFPILGKGEGLRQPVHAEDVASACIAALKAPVAIDRTYDLSGGETLTYREMVGRVYAALGRGQWLLTMPLFIFRMASVLIRLLSGSNYWTVATAERMNQDLVFDHKDAQRDLKFSPRLFLISEKDLPV